MHVNKKQLEVTWWEIRNLLSDFMIYVFHIKVQSHTARGR